MKFILALLVLPLVSSPLYKPAVKFCSTDSKNEATYCGKNPGGHPCLFYHPKEEFCEDETAPLPSCCRAADEKGFTGCSCCRSVHGSNRDILLEKVGSYFHRRDPDDAVVEYDIGRKP